MFALATMEAGLTPPIEYKIATGSAELGEAMVLSSGKLTRCGATAKPTFVVVGCKNAAGEVPVIRVQDYMNFETTLQADGKSLKVGSKVTIHSDGLQVTATTDSGVAEIISMPATAAGSRVVVKF